MRGGFRLWPGTLFGRLVVILSVGVSLALAASAALFLHERGRMLVMVGGIQTANRLAAVVQLLDPLSAEDRRRVAGVLESPLQSLAFFRERPPAVTGEREPVQAALVKKLLDRFLTGRQVEVTVIAGEDREIVTPREYPLREAAPAPPVAATTRSKGGAEERSPAGGSGTGSPPTPQAVATVPVPPPPSTTTIPPGFGPPSYGPGLASGAPSAYGTPPWGGYGYPPGLSAMGGYPPAAGYPASRTGPVGAPSAGSGQNTLPGINSPFPPGSEGNLPPSATLPGTPWGGESLPPFPMPFLGMPFQGNPFVPMPVAAPPPPPPAPAPSAEKSAPPPPPEPEVKDWNWTPVSAVPEVLPAGISFIVEVSLQDGTWLRLRNRLPEEAFAWPSHLVVPLAVLLVSVVILAFLAVKLVMRPLGVLIQAAAALGRDINQPPLPEKGCQELRLAALTINTMQSRLRRYLQERTHLLAALSHDLKTPITRMRLRAELIDDVRIQEKTLKDLDEMEEMASAALDFIRGMEGSEPLEKVDLNAMLETVQAEQEEMGRDCSLEGEPLPAVLLRPQGFKRCLSNLVNNAVAYGQCARMRVRREGGWVEVVVADDGPGIAEKDLERVFEPFVRLEKSRNRRSGGTGLGLGIARNIVQAHGGTLILRNRQPHGLEAVIRLPEHPPGSEAS
ncbi:MAG: HAMP domain-containing protein [Magnetococcales bacterium]|nr:HAMP domain-containing protein [Magnetococcales bacterium]